MADEKDIYISDNDLDQMDYSKDGLIWTINNVRYVIKQATADGYIFRKIK